jgi:hypothetical protein
MGTYIHITLTLLLLLLYTSSTPFDRPAAFGPSRRAQLPPLLFLSVAHIVVLLRLLCPCLLSLPALRPQGPSMTYIYTCALSTLLSRGIDLLYILVSRTGKGQTQTKSKQGLTLSLTAPRDPLYLTALGLICPIKIGLICPRAVSCGLL